MSRFFAYVPEAMASIWRNKTRSILSILGMVIGIASVIAVLGLSQAGSNGIKASIDAGGDPGYIALGDQSQNDPSLATMYYRDAALVAAYASSAVSRAVPLYNGHPFAITVSGTKDTIDLYSTYGIKEGTGVDAVSGRLISQDDVDTAAGVGILSKAAADKLYPHGDAVGQSFNIGSQRVRIVGVFVVTGSLFNSTVGDSIYVPYPTAHRISPGPIDFLQFWATPNTRPVDAIAAVRAALAKIHPRGQYLVQDQSASLGVFETILNYIGAGLTVIGGISLLVAGVGIMNIMLVSVTERTREIGIRKAIGASAGDISLQFLIEALILCAIGGLLGTALGVLIVKVGSGVIVASVGAAPVPWALVIGIAVVFSFAIGVIFGSVPASRAASLDPVEAIRS